ncbi:hypothetical protein [Kribbella sancticallisti]
MAPWWVAVAAAGIALLPRRYCGWVAAVLFLWGAGGVVLDAFRAFFWVTGIPAGSFAEVDWPGAARRMTCLVAAAVLSTGLLRGGESRHVWGSSWLGYAAFAAGFPYPMLKLYWSLGGSLARPAVYNEGMPVMELFCLVAGAAVSLALVQSWGRRLPRVVVLIPAWFATGVLINMGALMVFGITSQALGITDGPVDFDDASSLLGVGAVYLSWLVFGLTLGGATWAYQRTTRPIASIIPETVRL